MNADDPLPPSLERQLAALPRERQPSRLLEERTVRALREEGHLAPPGRPRRAWLIPAVAAGLLLFLGGIATGQWLATRQTAHALTALQRESALHAAAAVQQAGSAYTRSIAALNQVRDSANPEYLRQGREVALTAFYAAAAEIIRLSPDDPVAARILQVMDRPRHPGDSLGGTGNATRRVVWF